MPSAAAHRAMPRWPGRRGNGRCWCCVLSRRSVHEEAVACSAAQAGTVASQAFAALPRLRGRHGAGPGWRMSSGRTRSRAAHHRTPATARGDDTRRLGPAQSGATAASGGIRRGEGPTAMSQHRSRSDHDVLDRLVGSAVRDLAAHVRPAQSAPGAIAAGFRLRRRMRVRGRRVARPSRWPHRRDRRAVGPAPPPVRPDGRTATGRDPDPLRPPIRRARRPRRCYRAHQRVVRDLRRPCFLPGVEPGQGPGPAGSPARTSRSPRWGPTPWSGSTNTRN